MNSLLKTVAAKLPSSWQQELKRHFFAWQIRSRRFFSNEKEFAMLDSLLAPGDWVLDIGANIGYYSARFSELVGATGRVIAFEPVAETFELLAANVRHFPHRNVTLVNAAASDACQVVHMEMPSFDTGLANFYQARLTARATGLAVLCMPVDALALPHPVKLVKIDTEGHETTVLKGMRGLLERDRPMLVVEANSPSTADYLRGLGYEMEHLPGSSNEIFRHPAAAR